MASDAEAPRPPAGPRAALHLIGSRQFGPYFVGNAASASGTWFQNLAAQLLVYRLTHSPFLLRVLNFCNSPRLLVFLLIVTAVGFASDPINTLARAFAREFGYHDTVAGLITAPSASARSRPPSCWPGAWPEHGGGWFTTLT